MKRPCGIFIKTAYYRLFKEKGIECVYFGADSEQRTDYPIYGEKVARAVAGGQFEKGILICGKGIGISLAANKVCGIRAAVCSEPYSARPLRFLRLRYLIWISGCFSLFLRQLHIAPAEALY
jgi:RpiB/LacA/LacB family sugar-phosphate isomerase